MRVYELFISEKKSIAAQQMLLRRWINSSKYIAEMKNSIGNQLPAEVKVGKKPYYTKATAKELTKALIQAGFTYYGNSFCA